ncbi:MAG: thiamine phosphate synthase [Planctomycetota bacterium]|nr:thiamine phosphate synthase [Planctomycetota bacterium]
MYARGINSLLYLIADPRTGDAATLRRAIAGGVDAVQLRAKGAADRDVLSWAREMRAICLEAGIPFLLNDRVALVADARADGVHLGQEDMDPQEARALLGPDRIVGLSTHDRTEVLAARAADYLGLGPMFPTVTKDLTRTPGGPALVAAGSDATDLPLFPIGGIDETNLAVLVAAGARRAAVSGAIWLATDPRGAATRLRAILTASPAIS